MEEMVLKKVPDIIYHKGKPKAVILDIEDYKELLERLEDFEDLRELEEMRKKPMKFYDLEDVLNEIENEI